MSINEVPVPPKPFASHINSTLLPMGSELHRIHTSKYSGNAFNPSTEKLNWFSPIFNRGSVVPVLYAAEHLETAIFETIFHDAPVAGAKYQRLPLGALKKRHYSVWRVTRDLKLASLHAPDLRKFDLSVEQLTATDSMYYVQTARWAEAIMNTHHDIDGLRWTSYRGAPGLAYMLFGHRVRGEDLLLVGSEMAIGQDPSLCRAILACGARCGVRVTLPRLA